MSDHEMITVTAVDMEKGEVTITRGEPLKSYLPHAAIVTSWLEDLTYDFEISPMARGRSKRKKARRRVQSAPGARHKAKKTKRKN